MCHHLSKGHVLASAFSNVATDHLADALRRSGLHVVRVGTGGRSDLDDVTLQNLMEKHELWGRRDRLQNQIDSIRKEEKEIQTGPSSMRSRIAELKKKRDDLDNEIINAVICEADVVCATCAGAGHPLLVHQRFSVILVIHRERERGRESFNFNIID
jgi:hypothetical protein